MEYYAIAKGRLALIEKLPLEKVIILIFETPENITGQGMASIGVYGITEISEMQENAKLKAAFDARSVLTFDEDLLHRRKSKVKVSLGQYSGYGLLRDDPKCNFIFSSDILCGNWCIKYDRVSKNIILSKR